MPFNPSGTFNPAVVFVDGALATAEDQNTQDNDIANGLTGCMTRAGLAAATADQNFGGFKAVQLGAGVASTDGVNLGQIKGLINGFGGTSGGTANAQTLTVANFTGTNGQAVTFIAGFTNTGGVTLAVNGSVAATVYKDTIAGPVALTGKEITAGNTYTATLDTGLNGYHIAAALPSTVMVGPSTTVVGNLPAFANTVGVRVSDTGIAATALVVSVVVQTFSVTGTYTPNAKLLFARVTVVGGGGAGGGAAATGGATAAAGGGGGAGEIGVGIFSAATISTSQVVTIGAGGTASSGATGGNGGTTSLGSLITALGGSGGVASSAANEAVALGGAGGSGGTGGTIHYAGGAGLPAFAAAGGVSAAVAVGGGGAPGYLGAGGGAGAPATGAASGTGGAGGSPGAGGGGSANGTSQSGVSAGAGAAGLIFIEEFLHG